MDGLRSRRERPADRCSRIGIILPKPATANPGVILLSRSFTTGWLKTVDRLAQPEGTAVGSAKPQL